MVSRPSHYNSRYKRDLSPRQRDVLELIAAGKTNAEIADELGLTLDGAKWHVREILGKLEVESRDEAAAWWLEYRRPLARIRRAVTGIGGIGALKVVAAGGGLALVAAGATFGLLALLGRADDDADAASPPACRTENMRWGSSVERVGADVRVTVSIGLREPDWYEGIMRGLRLSDRRVDSPCLLDSTAGVDLYDNQTAAGPRQEIVRRPLEGVVNRPSLATVHAELRRGVATRLVTATFTNWCEDALRLKHLEWQIQIPARSVDGTPGTSAGLMVPLADLPACAEPNRAAEIDMAAVDTRAGLDPAALPACDLATLGLRLDVAAGYGQDVFVRALAFPPVPCRMEQLVQIGIRDETTGESFNGVSAVHTVVAAGSWIASAVLGNWCAAEPRLVAFAVSAPPVAVRADVPAPGCLDAKRPPAFSSVAHGNSAPAGAAGAGNRTYTVKAGDTVENIAQSYGVTRVVVEAANPGLTATNLNVGQVLSIPAPAP